MNPRRLLAAFETRRGVLLAVSGGPDSTALLLLAAQWRDATSGAPTLFAATIDHGLRPEARAEAEAVAALAGRLGIAHAILPWTGDKPRHGLQEAAREARYGLLARHARAVGADAVATAHTRDDQAETVLFRLMRGSGLAGLAGIPASRPLEGDLVLLRPLLDVPKAGLVECCRAAGVGYADDASNRDIRFARPRLRRLLPALAEEGLDGAAFARLAARAARADKALEAAVDAAQATTFLAPRTNEPLRLDKAALLALPEEIALRLLARSIAAVGHEGPAELGKLEALFAWLCANAEAPGAARTLAGALVRIELAAVCVCAAPPRRATLSSP